MKRRSSSSLFFTLCLLLLSSCDYGVKEVIDTENENSALLSLLVARTDLDGKWKWKETITLQRDTTAEKQSGSEYANKGLIGYYQNYLLTIEHELYCYDDSHPVDIEKRDYRNSDLTVQEIALTESDSLIYAQCQELSDTLHECHALSMYGNVVSDIEIRSPKEVDYSALTAMLNSLVVVTNERVGENPACGK